MKFAVTPLVLTPFVPFPEDHPVAGHHGLAHGGASDGALDDVRHGLQADRLPAHGTLEAHPEAHLGRNPRGGLIKGGLLIRHFFPTSAFEKLLMLFWQLPSQSANNSID